ncbi:hypothetical protein OUZ56_013849 [Daphnia magna]|uniref:Uncharacterized protein n=1 Tax=Daphnia magna TaxID=35525 RepID=A0ABQ9Z749_9CRUS|nr:hypothetical protein OUZ56_013849 [Daphnia magna]
MHKFEIEMLGTPYRSTRVVKWSRHEKSDISTTPPAVRYLVMIVRRTDEEVRITTRLDINHGWYSSRTAVVLFNQLVTV